MKKLSLSILLLLLSGSNAQAGVYQWTQQKVQQAGKWIKENKKKAIVSAVALGAATYLGYKAHKAYPDLSLIAAMRKCLSNLLEKESCEICGPKVWGVAAATLFPIPGIGHIARASSDHNAHVVCDSTLFVVDACGE